ncbi:phosphatidylinositol glycan, class B [Chitinophaga sp. YR627]|uniref:hypothetical protein n=1 Tax=Chitinophaga sp. YR627 TaxID=1881041 RepID=UPI0008E58905|nr:hypothetical protein [Chitinophaga sp. YR627]SFM59502.1 phosphatidylinositol glycan, class B [Chitinophaga sp. YR627]
MFIRPSFQNLLTILAIIIYGVTALNSHGYYNADEHYQIIEFANLKSGINSPAEMAWEYGSMLRSTIQPWICYTIFSTMHLFGISDPYILAAILRFLTMIFAISVIRYTVNTLGKEIPDAHQIIFSILSWFLWFLPFINIRFSAECWSGLCLLSGTAVLHKNTGNNPSYLIAGFWLGLAYLFRFQTGIAIASIICYSFFIRKTTIQHIFTLISAIAFVAIIGGILDSVYYGRFVITAVNYFQVNIIKGVASRFGTSTVFQYMQLLVQASVYPIGIFITLSILVFAIRRPKHLITWVVLPFIFLHLAIPHKEIRFLFPIVNFLPFIIISAWQIPVSRSLPALQPVLIIICILVNIPGIAVNMNKDADNGRQDLTRRIAKEYGDRPLRLLYGKNGNPYKPWPFLTEHFYTRSNVECISIESYDSKNIDIVVIKKTDIADPVYSAIIKKNHLRQTVQSIPAWIEKIDQLHNCNHHPGILVLFERAKY